jgi:hypothetical protein
MGGLFAAVFGVFWTAMAASIPRAPMFFPLFGCGFIAFGIGTAVNSYRKMNGFQQAEQDYHWRRSRLLSQLGKHRHDR